MMLYAGTVRPIPRKEWVKESPDISVQDLNEHDNAVKSHFTKPEVQNIGSTSGCGCDFPNVLMQNGEWPASDESESDPEQIELEQFNPTDLSNSFGLLESQKLNSMRCGMAISGSPRAFMRPFHWKECWTAASGSRNEASIESA